MVGGAMRLSQNLSEYFNQKKSFLNPSNIGYSFFVYGTFPLVITKYLAVALRFDNYNDFTLLGRFLSALVDFLTVILVYKTAKLLLNKIIKHDETFENIPLLSAFFYAVSVYPIQSAHFFTTDTFLNFFMLGGFYFILKMVEVDRFLYLIFSSLFFSLALSSKISALYILPLNLGILLLIFIFKKDNLIKRIISYSLFAVCYLLISYLFLRIFDPYYFQNPSFFDFALNKNFIESLKSLTSLSNREAWYPPAVQWINKPWYGLLLTTFFSGLGPINFIVMIVGLIYIILKIKNQSASWRTKIHIKNQKRRYSIFLLVFIIFWVLGYFVYQSFQFAKSIRYTIYLYPFLAIFGGVGMVKFEALISKFEIINNLFRYLKIKKLGFFWDLGFRILNLLMLLVWPLLFSTIYFHPHTRVKASTWIYQSLKNNSIILGEHWDDPLPLPMDKNYGKNFQVELLPVFDPDTSEKWQKMRQLFEKADYYVLSSNRGWGSISTVPSRYPLMSQYYQALLNDNCEEQKKLTGYCFKKIKTFEPYYYKFIKYPDRWVEETFTVYDHPTVIILKKV